MTAPLNTLSSVTSRLPDGTLLLSETLRDLFAVLGVQAPVPLTPTQIPDLLEAARTAAGPHHPLLTPMLDKELAELAALVPPQHPPGALTVFTVRVIAALKPGDRKHSVHHYSMVARSAEEATAHLKSTRAWVMSSAVHVAVETGPSLTGPAIVHSGISQGLTPAQVALVTGVHAGAKAEAPRSTKPTNRPLSETQRHVLLSLQKHTLWHASCGWAWGSSSNTRRVLESLERRGLARCAQGTFTLTQEGEQALDPSSLSLA